MVMSFVGFNVPIPFERARLARELLAETKLRLFLAEAARTFNAQVKSANAARPGSDSQPDQWAGDREEGEGDQPNW
jgi:hypothetical protein